MTISDNASSSDKRNPKPSTKEHTATIELPANIVELDGWITHNSKKGRGRPRTNPSLAEYTFHRIMIKANALIDEIFGEFGDLWSRDKPSYKAEYIERDGMLWYRVTIPLADPKSESGFVEGMRVAVEIFERAVLPKMMIDLIEKDELKLNMTKEAIRRENLKESPLPADAKKAKAIQFLRESIYKNNPLPSDIRRKVRRPPIPRSKLLRLTRAIKEVDGPAYYDLLAEELQVTTDVIEELYREAKRQRFHIKKEKDNSGKEFLKI